MPPKSVHPGGKSRRVFLAAVVLVILAAGLYVFVTLGSFLAREDPLEKADAIMVLSGTPMRRGLEAAELLLMGYGQRLVLTREARDAGELALLERGIVVPENVEVERDVFEKLGVPREAIMIPPTIHDSTAAEAETLRQLAAREGWRRVIVVTSPYHLRRAGFAIRRALRGADVQVIMRRTRYETAQPDAWWRRRRDIRTIVTELPKLIAYVAGLGA
jgi:uncharacterized SAM-binding protein YcdF (DUF218 family)